MLLKIQKRVFCATYPKFYSPLNLPLRQDSLFALFRKLKNKKGADDLFDRLNTSILNEYLNGLMPGLTAKVFRTYNASITLQEQLNELTDQDDNVVAKVIVHLFRLFDSFSATISNSELAKP